MSARKIARFVQSLAQNPDISEIILWHLSVSQRRTQVARHDSWDSPDDIASTLWEEARNYATAFPGPQSFVLTAHEKPDLDLNSPTSSTGFKVDPVDSLGPNDQAGSEPPTSEGLTSQLMRHVENKERLIGSMFGTVVSYLVRDNEKKSDYIEQLVGQRIEAFEQIEQSRSLQHLRDLELKEKENEKDKSQKMIDGVKQYLPLLLNHLAGKEIVRQKDSEMEVMAMELARSLKPTQLDEIKRAGHLTQAQSMLLASLIERTTRRMVALDEAAKAAADAHKIANTVDEPSPKDAEE